jgi:hypothetical protein
MPPDSMLVGITARPEVGSVKLPDVVASDVCTCTLN